MNAETIQWQSCLELPNVDQLCLAGASRNTPAFSLLQSVFQKQQLTEFVGFSDGPISGSGCHLTCSTASQAPMTSARPSSRAWGWVVGTTALTYKKNHGVIGNWQCLVPDSFGDQIMHLKLYIKLSNGLHIGPVLNKIILNSWLIRLKSAILLWRYHCHNDQGYEFGKGTRVYFYWIKPNTCQS